MSPKDLIRSFLPFNLQHRQADDEMYRDVQECIYYGESQCRAILAGVLRAPSRNVKWMQLYLQTELHVITSYIGIMTAVGRVVDIPLVIRSLVDGLLVLRPEHLPVSFESEFVQIIEAGTGEGFGKVVQKYHLQWWTASKEPGRNWLLTCENIFDCVDHYTKELEIEERSQSSIIIVPNPQLSAEHLGGAMGGTGDGANATYRKIATHSTQHLRDLLNVVNGQRRAKEAKVQVAARQTATLYLLLETIMHKETLDTPAPGPINRNEKGATALKIMQKSKSLFNSGKDKIPAEQQWSFGTYLTKQDVLGLVHIPGQELRTGYNTTLTFNSLSGDDTIGGVPEDITSDFEGDGAASCAADANAPIPDNTVPSQSSKFYPARSTLKLPSDFNARKEYLSAHPQEKDEADKAWVANKSKWDTNGIYIGQRTAPHISDDITNAYGAPSGGTNLVTSVTMDHVSLAALNSPQPRISNSLAVLYSGDTDSDDSWMSSPPHSVVDEPAGMSLAELFSDHSSDGGSFSSSEDLQNLPRLADLYGTSSSEGDDNSSSGASPMPTYTAADFDFVSEHVFDEENLRMASNDSGSD